MFDYSSNTVKYPTATTTKDFGNIAVNSSGGTQFILGEDDPEWEPLEISIANPATMVRIYINDVVTAQLKLKDLIEAQSTTGDGSVLEDGVTSSNGTITGDANTSIVIGGGSIDNDAGTTETKMFFSDGKAAFRVGTVSGTSWDDDNTGQSSFATGNNTTASGLGSVASGQGTVASGEYSTASGQGSEAKGNHSSASGQGTIAEATYEVAVGSYNTDDAVAGDATDKAFSIGNGTGTGSRSNAFVVRKNGNTEITGVLTLGNYDIPNAVGSENKILAVNSSGNLEFVDNTPAVLSDGATLSGDGTSGTALAINLANANTWTGKQTFDDASITVPSGSSVTMSALNNTSFNQSLYIDKTSGVITASNGAPARAASGMISGKHTATATTTQTILDGNVKTGSVIIVTYQGTIAASYRITAITDGSGFTLEFSTALVAGETIHYMIIN